jgi:hypothetical protein
LEELLTFTTIILQYMLWLNTLVTPFTNHARLTITLSRNRFTVG